MKKNEKKWLSLITSIVMMAQLCLIVLPTAVKAETTSIFTDYLPTITQTTDAEGFIHPGVGLTKELLENVRTKVRAGAQPWTYYFNSMLLPAPEASKTISSSNSGDGKTPSADYFNSQGIEGKFIADGLKAYSQAFMYYMTGDDVYRANAMMIIRIWEQMDPTKYVWYTDAHIHTGVPLNRMVMAAEILRYTSTQTASLAWTDQDTADFTNHLIIPVTETFMHSQNHFMNQHTYPLLGAMAGYIFTGNRDRYNEAVEWFTVNRSADDQGFNGSIKALFRWVTEEEQPGTKVGEGTPVEPHVQQMEMGRDQAHGGGDLTNSAMITRLIHAQGTKIDPVAGTPSTADNAVDIMEFLNNRILGATNYFWQFMLGYDTPWTPQAYAITGGDPDNVGMGGYIRDTYNSISNGYKGRFWTANFWDFYSYYTYVKHEDVAQIAPYYYEAFTKKLPPSVGGWENHDAGNDFWLYLPPEAEADAAKFIPQDKSSGNILQLEDRYTKLDNNTALMQEGDTSFIRFNATQEGSKIAVLSFAGAAGSGPFGFKIRTNGVSTFDGLGSTFTLPDTKGEWKYVSLVGYFGDIVYMTVKGTPGVTVDIDSVDAAAGTNLTPPVFKAGSSDLKIYTYVGASVNVDLSATDANSTDVITYELQNNSKGLPIDANTGVFSWKPTEAGNYSVVVAATDGTTVSVKNVNIIVSSDRASAVQAIIASYDQNQVYVVATLNNFQTVYNDTLSLINTASDVDFDKQLQALRAATDGLTLVTPLTNYGGMNWSKVAAWSTWGSTAPNMDDGDWDSGAWFGLAQGYPPHLYHLVDFGPDYKVSAAKFGFKSNIFVDRLANSTVYGSNDKVNWTRLTPGVTQYTQAYHTLDVDPALQNEKYRYIKLEMIQPLPAVLYGTVSNLLELNEFDIYGTRYEIGNKLQLVSLSSDQALNGRVALGNTVKASIIAKEAIQNVKVKIQGQDATVSTTDNINWTATATLTGKDQTGDVKVSVDYTKQDGTNGDTLYGTTDGSKLFAADESDLINATELALVSDSSGRSPEDARSTASSLFDGNPGTGTDYRVNGSGYGGWVEFDFLQGGYAQLSSVELLARQDGYGYSRISGAVVQGSNDNTDWTTISTTAASTLDWQKLTIKSTEKYRYIRIFNGNNWYGNMSEVRFHGTAKVLTKINAVSIRSDQGTNRIKAGDTVKLTFAAIEPINAVKVKIQGRDATVHSDDNLNWTAEATTDADAVPGQVHFSINYKTADGEDAPEITSTTDGSSVLIADMSNYIDVPMLAAVTDSAGRSPTDAASAANALFDNNPVTATDYRLNGSGAGSWVGFDFREGASVKLKYVELLARQDGFYTRINGAVIQGSNDNTNWTTISTSAKSTRDWQILTITDNTPYRYIRIYNGNAWYGNMAEVSFHGDLEYDATYIDSVMLAPDGYTKASYYLYQQKVKEIKAELVQPGANGTALIAEYVKAVQQLVRIPLSLYSFEGNANDMYGSNVGTVNGTATYEAGQSGKAISLNGSNSYVDLSATHPLANDDQITIATWVNWKGGNQWQRIFDFGNNTNQYLFLTPRSGNNTLRFATKNGGGEQLVQTSQLPTNQWVHVAVTLGNGTAKLYVNGTLAATANGITIKPSDFHPSRNYIGKSQFSDPLFNGMIDEFAIYNYALNDSEIQALYQKGAQWTDKSLVELLLNQSEQVAANRYTVDSYAALQTAEVNATSVDANTEATQSEVDAAADSLKTSLDNLIYKITAFKDPAGPNGTNDWYTTTPVTVTLSTYGRAEYTLDGGTTWQNYTDPLTFNEEGKYSVGYRSRNEAGIAGDVQTVAFNMDTTAPTITVTGLVYGTYDDSTDITPGVTLDDNLSGVDNSKTTVTLDTYGIQAGESIPLYTLSLGSHVILVTASDLAGNTSRQTVQFQTTVSIASMKALVDRFLNAGWIDDEGIANSLQSKLDANALSALVNEVKAQSGKHISEQAAQYLLRDAEYELNRP